MKIISCLLITLLALPCFAEDAAPVITFTSTQAASDTSYAADAFKSIRVPQGTKIEPAIKNKKGVAIIQVVRVEQEGCSTETLLSLISEKGYRPATVDEVLTVRPKIVPETKEITLSTGEKLSRSQYLMVLGTIVEHPDYPGQKKIFNFWEEEIELNVTYTLGNLGTKCGLTPYDVEWKVGYHIAVVKK